jgi:hypothetical protein
METLREKAEQTKDEYNAKINMAADEISILSDTRNNNTYNFEVCYNNTYNFEVCYNNTYNFEVMMTLLATICLFILSPYLLFIHFFLLIFCLYILSPYLLFIRPFPYLLSILCIIPTESKRRIKKRN